MSTPSDKLPRSYALDERAAQAAEELGQTEGARGPKLALCFAFLLTLFSVPLIQTVAELRSDAGPPQNLSIFGRLGEAAGILFSARPPASMPHPDHAPARLEATGLLDRLFLANRFLLRSIDEYEDDLRDDSLLSSALQPAMQTIFAAWFGLGNDKTLLGQDGWLFFHESVSHLTRAGFLDPARQRQRASGGSEWQPPPQPDPVAALLHFRLMLARRGIPLVIVPVPNKPVLYADALASDWDPCTRGPVHNPSTARMLAELAQPELFFRDRFAAVKDLLRGPAFRALRPRLAELAAGRDLLEQEPPWVFDPTDDLLRARCRDGQPVFLKADLHWRPEAVIRTATGLARFLRQRLPLDPVWEQVPPSEKKPVEALGDLGRLLRLPAAEAAVYRQAITISQVQYDDGLMRADRRADVLLVGDSFTNIYSLEAMGWGEGAGLAEHLARALRRPVDSIARNDRGAYQSRQELDRELGRGSDRLAGKRVVIFEFNGRELSHGDWKLLPLTLGSAPAGGLWVPAAGAERIVQGTVQSISHVPRPFAVPYGDHICAVHLVDLRAADGRPLPAAAATVAYMFSMRDHRWTPVPRLRMGDRIRVALSAWDESAHGSINRSDLDDLEFERHSFARLQGGPGTGAATAPARPGFGWPEGLALTVLAALLAALLWWLDRRERRAAGPAREGVGA